MAAPSQTPESESKRPRCLPSAACSGLSDYHCQDGTNGDLCWAARLDGTVCPHDSCDVDDGIVDYDPSIPPRERIPNVTAQTPPDSGTKNHG